MWQFFAIISVYFQPTETSISADTETEPEFRSITKWGSTQTHCLIIIFLMAWRKWHVAMSFCQGYWALDTIYLYPRLFKLVFVPFFEGTSLFPCSQSDSHPSSRLSGIFTTGTLFRAHLQCHFVVHFEHLRSLWVLPMPLLPSFQSCKQLDTDDASSFIILILFLLHFAPGLRA